MRRISIKYEGGESVGYFHQWVVEDSETYAIAERDDGVIEMVRWDNVRFTPPYHEHERSEKRRQIAKAISEAEDDGSYEAVEDQTGNLDLKENPHLPQDFRDILKKNGHIKE